MSRQLLWFLPLIFVIVAGCSNDEPVGVVFWACNIDRTSNAKPMTVGIVDRSNDQLPKPQKGATCSQYLAELMEAGSCPPPADSCYGDIDEAYPISESCIRMVIFGPAFC